MFEKVTQVFGIIGTVFSSVAVVLASFFIGRRFGNTNENGSRTNDGGNEESRDRTGEVREGIENSQGNISEIRDRIDTSATSVSNSRNGISRAREILERAIDRSEKGKETVNDNNHSN